MAKKYSFGGYLANAILAGNAGTSVIMGEPVLDNATAMAVAPQPETPPTAATVAKSVADIAKSSYKFGIYPNPTDGRLTISSPETGSIIISNMLGQPIGKYDISTGNNVISLPANVPAGVYNAVFTDVNSKVKTVLINYQP